MWKPNSLRNMGRVNRLAVITGALVVVWVCVGAAEPSSFVAGGQQTEALQIEVTLDEYSFSPDPVRVPAGRPVTLVIRNAGRFPHEFMAGQEVAGDDFELDLFADVHVNSEPVATADAGHEGHADPAETAEHAEAEHDAPEHGHGAAEADHHAGVEARAHPGRHQHGTMVEVQAGETVLMTFTLPESRRGEWMTGCFLPGHYDAGMHGALIVE